jgi:hypothetical protein
MAFGVRPGRVCQWPVSISIPVRSRIPLALHSD